MKNTKRTVVKALGIFFCLWLIPGSASAVIGNYLSPLTDTSVLNTTTSQQNLGQVINTGDYCEIVQNGYSVSKAMNTVPVTFTAHFNKETFIGRVSWQTAFNTYDHFGISGKTDSYTTTYNKGTTKSTVIARAYGSGDIGGVTVQATLSCTVDLYDPPTIYSADVTPTTFDPSKDTSINLNYVLDDNFTGWNVNAYLMGDLGSSSIIGPIKLDTSYGTHDLKLDVATFSALKTLSAGGTYHFEIQASNSTNTVKFEGSNFSIKSAPLPLNKYMGVNVSGLTVTPNPFDPASSTLSVKFNVDTKGNSLDLGYKILDSGKTNVFFNKTDSGINKTGSMSFTWDGKDSSSKVVAAGDYVVIISLMDVAAHSVLQTINQPFSVVASGGGAPAGGGAGDGGGGGAPAGGGGAPAGGGASDGGTPAGGGASDSGAGTPYAGPTDTGLSATDSGSVDTGAAAGTGEVTLKPSPDILTCKGSSKTLYFNGDQPSSDMIGMSCVLKQSGLVSAGIYNKSFDPKAADNSANLIKQIKTGEQRNKGQFYVSWDGMDNTDQAAALDEYVFAVSAIPTIGYSPDTSIQKFKIADINTLKEASANAGNTATTQGQTGADTNGQTSLTDQALHGAAGVASNIGNAAAAAGEALQSMANSVLGSGNDTTGQNGGAAAVASKEPSKCPGNFYPTDINGSVFESVIKAAYDLCLVKGYPDGTFKPEQGLTRAEATKIMILATGHLAKVGCYDNDCGSPFMDLDMWQGPWVRAAWDLRMVSGIGTGHFIPNRMITRAEAVALIVKAFGIAPHQGCWSANCGAGFPNNLFADISLAWEGQYLRALWDAQVIAPDANSKFYPDIPVSRGQFIYWVTKLIKTPTPSAATGNGATVVENAAGGTPTGGTSTPVGTSGK